MKEEKPENNVEKNITAKIVRTVDNTMIVVEHPDLGEINLYEDLVDHIAKILSAEELRNILEKCETQISQMGADNVPLSYIEIINELKKAMEKRAIISKKDKNYLDGVLKDIGKDNKKNPPK